MLVKAIRRLPRGSTAPLHRGCGVLRMGIGREKAQEKLTAKKGTVTVKTIKKLTSKKTYFVKIKAYKTVDGRKIYTKDSAKKRVRVK